MGTIGIISLILYIPVAVLCGLVNKYHIVFAPKYRRKVFYKEKRAMIGKILRQLCEWKGMKIIEAEACPDHIHLFVEIRQRFRYQGLWGTSREKVLQ